MIHAWGAFAVCHPLFFVIFVDIVSFTLSSAAASFVFATDIRRRNITINLTNDTNQNVAFVKISARRNIRI